MPKNPQKECYLATAKRRKHWILLEEYGFMAVPAFAQSPICPLANYYQFFREVLFAIHHTENSRFILVYDERNPMFNPRIPRNIWTFLMTFVPAGIQEKCRALSIQSILGTIKEDSMHSAWAKLFREKAGL